MLLAGLFWISSVPLEAAQAPKGDKISQIILAHQKAKQRPAG